MKLRLVLKENSFQFNGKNYLQIHGTAMGTKMAVSFANLFMSAVETKILNESTEKPLVWKRYIDDVFSLWNTNIEDINGFIEQANRHHPTIKFTAEICMYLFVYAGLYIYGSMKLMWTCRQLTTHDEQRPDHNTGNSVPYSFR